MKRKSLFLLAIYLILSGLIYGQTNENNGLQSSEDNHPDTLFSRGVDELIRESDVAKKEEKYKVLITKFPEDGGEFRKMKFNNVRISLVLLWSSRGNGEKVMEYYNQVKDGLSPGLGVAFAGNLVKNHHYEKALTILNDLMAAITTYATEKSSIYTYLQAYDYYAQALFELGKKEEALKYARDAYDKSDKKNTQVNSTYSKVLNGLDRHEEALPIMENLVRDGMATDEIKNLYRKSYIHNGGSSGTYDKQVASLVKELKEKMEKEAKEKLINEPAYHFSLTDMNGKTVSLQDLKGKVVILDFWATWCGPCINSMPAMQKLVNKYKNDPRIAFLFIDTGEKIPDYEAAVKKFMDEKKYDFHVLFDVRDPITKKCPVATGYLITGIPTKLVLDGNGRLRYRVVGFSGGFDATVEELTAMIENVKM